MVGAALDYVFDWTDEEIDAWFTDDDRWLQDWWSSRRMTQNGHGSWIFRRNPSLKLPIDDSRSYALFGALTTTVRGWGAPGITSRPRGLPEDCTEYARRFLGPGVHSISWVDAREVLEYREVSTHKAYVDVLGRLGAQEWAEAYGADHVRWVFGFDS